MCLITLSFNQHPDYPLIVVQNRDEFYNRPSESLHFWEDEPNVLAGRDTRHGGTWSGITRTGRFASLNNRPFTDFEPKKDTRSRGDLVKNYLASEDSPEAWLQKMLDQRREYDSYQMVFGTLENLYVYSNSADRIFSLKPGLHSFSNTDDELSQYKLDRSCDLVEDYLNSHSEPVLDELVALFSDTEKAEYFGNLPSELSQETARTHSAIFIEGQDFGTVNTTALLVKQSGEVKVKEQRYDQNKQGEATEKSFLLHSDGI